MTTTIRAYNDFNVGLFDREIEVMANQRGILRWTRSLVVIMLIVFVLAILAGVLTPWAMLISFGAMGYGLWVSNKAIRDLNEMISQLQQKRAVAVHLRRFCIEGRCKLDSLQLERWLAINAPGSSYACGESSHPGHFLIAFPDEDTRMLFRLTHL